MSHANACPSSPIEIDAGGRWFTDRDGRKVSLGRARVAHRLVAALVDRWQKSPGESIPTTEIFGIGWPSENIRPDSAQARVYMAISRLRARGLSGIVKHDHAGYLISPGVELRVCADA